MYSSILPYKFDEALTVSGKTPKILVNVLASGKGGGRLGVRWEKSLLLIVYVYIFNVFFCKAYLFSFYYALYHI